MTEQQWLNIFGPMLWFKIQEAGYLTQEDFAEDIGVSPATLSKYLNKTQMPGVKTLINISYVLDIPLRELMDYGQMID